MSALRLHKTGVMPELDSAIRGASGTMDPQIKSAGDAERFSQSSEERC